MPTRRFRRFQEQPPNFSVRETNRAMECLEHLLDLKTPLSDPIKIRQDGVGRTLFYMMGGRWPGPKHLTGPTFFAGGAVVFETDAPITVNGTTTFNGAVSIGGGFGFKVAHVTLAADQNDYVPPGGANVLVIDTAADRTITGFVKPVFGHPLWVVNASTSKLRLAHASTSSAAANRMLLPSAVNKVLGPGDGFGICYAASTGDSRWHALDESATVFQGGLLERLSYNWTFSLATGEYLPFTAAAINEGGIWTGANPTRFVIPETGEWLMGFECLVGFTADDGYVAANLHVNHNPANSVAFDNTSFTTAGITAQGAPYLSGSGLKRLQVGDYVELLAFGGVSPDQTGISSYHKIWGYNVSRGGGSGGSIAGNGAFVGDTGSVLGAQYFGG